MTPKIRKPALPSTEGIADAPTRRFLDRVRETVEVWDGVRAGDAEKLDAVITKRDLIELGIAARGRGGALIRSGELANALAPAVPDFLAPAPTLPIPPAPTGFEVASGFTNAILSWDNPYVIYENHAFTEIWSAQVDDLGQAVRIATSPAAVAAVPLQGTGITEYYWIRFVSTDNVAGPFNGVAGTLGGTGLINGVDLSDLIISSEKLAESAVESGKIANGAIIRDKLVDSAIDAAKLDVGAVTEDKLNAGAVTQAKIGAAAIGAAAIQDLAVGNAAIANGAITNAKIGYAAIDGVNIAQATIVRAKIADGEITRAKIQRAAIDTAQIEAAAITRAKVLDGAIVRAKIGRAAIDSAKIDTAAVQTLKIQGDAVRVTAYGEGERDVDSFEWQEVLTLVETKPLAAINQPFIIHLRVYAAHGNPSGQTDVRLVRNATTLYSTGGGGSGGSRSQTFFTDLTGSVGSHTYRFEARASIEGGFASVRLALDLGKR